MIVALVSALLPSIAQAEPADGPWTALLEGASLAVRDDWETASARIERLPAKRRPPELDAVLALTLTAAGRPAAASAALERALSARPTLAEAHFWAGVIALRAGRPRPALEAFDLALALRPDRPEYRLARALAHAGTGGENAAIEDLIAAALLEPNLLEPAYHPDERRGVIRLLERSLERFPGKAATGDIVIRLLFDAGLYREARARASTSSGAVALEVRGRLALDAGDPVEAENLLNRALSRDPASVEARFHLARATFARGSHARARQLLREAAELAPGDARLQLALGDLDLEQGDLDGAELAYGYALARRRSPRALLGLGRVRELRGDLDGARRAYHDALILAPAGIEPLERMARLLERSDPGVLEARTARRRLDAATKLERRLEALVATSRRETDELAAACEIIEREPEAAAARIHRIGGPRGKLARSFALTAIAARTGRVREARQHAKVLLRSMKAREWARGARPWIELRGALGTTSVVRIVPVDFVELR